VGVPRDQLQPLTLDNRGRISMRVAHSAITALNRLQSAIADAQPATAGERWDYNDGTASGG
jgi:hypothetical protein